MARSRTRQQAEPEPAVEENGQRDWTDLKDKTPTWQAEAFAAWIKDETGINITAKQVQAVTAMRVAFRQSEAYEDAKAEHQSDNGQEQPEPEAKPARSRSRRGAKQEQAQPATRTRSRNRSRTAKAEAEAEPEPEAEQPKPARRTRRSRAAKGKAETESPDTTPEAPF